MTKTEVRHETNAQSVPQSSLLDLMGTVFEDSKKDGATAKFLDDLVGDSSSGYGHTKSCGINLAILVTALAGIAAMAFVLYSKITMNKGRRKKRNFSFNDPLINAWDIVTLYNIEAIILGGRLKFYQPETVSLHDSFPFKYIRFEGLTISQMDIMACLAFLVLREFKFGRK